MVNGQPWTYPLLALALYEPFALLFGLIGGGILLVTFRGSGSDRLGSCRGSRGLTLFVWLAGGLLLLAILSGGRGVGDVALVCVPLAVLAGLAVERLAESW